MFELLKEHK